MSAHDGGELLTLHLPATTGGARQVRHRMYDFAWYPQWQCAMAFIGHEPVALYDARTDEIVPADALRTEFVRWARGCRPQRDDDTVTLTERGRAEANVLHAMSIGAGDPQLAGARFAERRIAEALDSDGTSDTL